MSITIRKILHFFNKLRDIKKTFEKVTHFTPLHPTAATSKWRTERGDANRYREINRRVSYSLCRHCGFSRLE